MAAGGDRQHPRLPPVFAFRLDLEAVLPQPLDRGVEVGDDDGEVAGRGDRRVLHWHQVHLRPLALEPGVFAQRLRRLHPREPDQLEEADSGLDVSRRYLDPNVVEHRRKFTEMIQLCMFLSSTVAGMEAAVAEREVEMTEWNDGRLDELSRRVDNGFGEMREEFIGVNKRIDYLGERFDGMQKTLMQIGGGILVALIGLVATLIGLVATQL
jgi:hypothetical protein